MNTRFFLMAQYNGAAVIPLDRVCTDYFSHLTPQALAAKIQRGDVKLPMIRMEAASQKAAKGVHIDDLADWIDARREAAKRELKAISA